MTLLTSITLSDRLNGGPTLTRIQVVERPSVVRRNAPRVLNVRFDCRHCGLIAAMLIDRTLRFRFPDLENQNRSIRPFPTSNKLAIGRWIRVHVVETQGSAGGRRIWPVGHA